MITTERTRRPGAFPRWPSRITRPEPVSGSAPGSGASITAPRHHGWTVWFGRHTRQYWAAHTGLMRLVCADGPEELLRAITAATGPPGAVCLSGSRRRA